MKVGSVPRIKRKLKAFFNHPITRAMLYLIGIFIILSIALPGLIGITLLVVGGSIVPVEIIKLGVISSAILSPLVLRDAYRYMDGRKKRND